MKTINFLLILLMPLLGFSQNYIEKTSSEVINGEQMTVIRTTADRAATPAKQYNFFETSSRSVAQDYSTAVEAGVILEFNKQNANSFRNASPANFTMDIPVAEDGRTLTLELKKVNIFAEGFQVFTSGNPGVPMDYELGLHYQGKVAGQDGALVAISLFEDRMMGMIQTERGRYTLGKLDNSASAHIVYKDTDLKQTYDLSCATEDDGIAYRPEQLQPLGTGRDAGDCTRIYIEIDQSLTDGAGGAAAATTFATGLFNQSAVIYTAEMIETSISEIFVWTTPDPYMGPSAGQYRAQFQTNTGAFNGDLGHLLALDNVGVRLLDFLVFVIQIRIKVFALAECLD